MDKQYIKNLKEIGRSKGRLDMLHIVNAGLLSIDTKNSIQEKISLEGDILHAGTAEFDLRSFNKVVLFAFGKASVESVVTLEEILGDKLTSGIALDKRDYTGSKVKVFEGSHPHPSMSNVAISTMMSEEAQQLTEKDLAIVVVSGGGSALLCYPESECEQGNRLYDAFLTTGGSVRELNTVRKHISNIKGGGFAKTLYPATVIGLVLCDVSGEYYEEVASGPTYKDTTTVDDAKKILEKYDITEDFVFTETPKEDMYFENVINIPIVSNAKALDAMKKKGEELGYTGIVLGLELYDEPEIVIKKMIDIVGPKTVVIGGGEPSLKMGAQGGSGGRNEYTTLSAIKLIDDDSVFSSIASDGIDNHSLYAGAIVDKETRDIIQEKKLDLDEALRNFDPENLFLKTKDLIEMGDTGSNVSDLFLLLKD